ncbi:MAG: molecular chaperone TorD family protein [Haloarculaceae archaeon]
MSGEVPDAGDGRFDPAAADRSAAARGAVYGFLATAFDSPDERLHAAVRDGEAEERIATLLDRSGLDVEPPALRTDDDHDTLCARYNDLFVLGYSEVVDPTDGTVDSRGPPVPPYESAYRDSVSWRDVNLDLARAYEYFGVDVDTDERENHDHAPLVLEFAGYLCRLEALGNDGVADARLDLLDRHVRPLVEGLAAALADESGTGVYGDVATLADRFTAAEVAGLAARRESGAPHGDAVPDPADGASGGEAE